MQHEEELYVIGNHSGSCAGKCRKRRTDVHPVEAFRHESQRSHLNDRSKHCIIPWSVFPSKPSVCYLLFTLVYLVPDFPSKEKAQRRSPCVLCYVGQLPPSKGQAPRCISRAGLEENQRAPVHPEDRLCVFNVL